MTPRVSIITAPSLSTSKLIHDLGKLVQYRDLLYTLSIHRIKVRYKQSVLGGLWAILQPVSLMLMFTFIFSFVAKIPSDGAPYAIFVYTALLPWNYFSSSVSNATGSLVNHAQFVTKVYFPREILPATYVIASLFDFVVASVVLVGLMMYYRVPLTIHALYVVPIVLILTCFALAMSLFLSATQVRFRDIGVAVPLLLQLWLFATPVIYPLSSVPERFRSIYQLNPMVGVIDGFRWAILGSSSITPQIVTVAVALSTTVFIGGAFFFRRVERSFADTV